MRKLDYDDIEEGLEFTYGKDKSYSRSMAGKKCYIYQMVGEDREYVIVKTLENVDERRLKGYKFGDCIDDIIKSGSYIDDGSRKQYHPDWW